jgi:hypothetical protein
MDKFSDNLKSLIETTLSQKTAEIEERERLVAIREANIDHIMKNNHIRGRIKLQVGSVVFDTSADILKRDDYSYFHGFLNPEFNQGKDGLFIARDGEVFKYILEYLTYGKLLSTITDPGLGEKLRLDAEFYLLPGLLQQLPDRKDPEIPDNSRMWFRIRSKSSATNNTYFCWDTPDSPQFHSRHFTAADNNTAIVVKTKGLYQIFVSYGCVCSGNSHAVDLYVNDTVVTRNYHGQSDGYQQSRLLQHIHPIAAGDKIKVLYKSNSASVTDPLATSLTLLLL